MNHSEKELAILEKIHKSKDSIKQRDLAKIAGLSLGMTNVILKRLVEKGFLTVKKVNNRNLRYAVSPLGMEEISKRSFRYFKRTIKNVVIYKEAIGDIIKEAKEKGFTRICLAGKSDIDFIIEHACSKNHISFENVDDTYSPYPKDYVIFSENIDHEPSSELMETQYLKDIITG